MISAGGTADWVDAERRKQNAVLLALMLACLLVAIFPRNERRLFAFNGERDAAATIAPPVQTRLRAGIWDQPMRSRGNDNSPVLQVPREFIQPTVEPSPEWIPLVDPWRDGLMNNEPLQFDNGWQLPGLADLTGPDRGKIKIPNGGPRFFGYIPNFGIGGVPEPGTWAMMILGVSAVAYRVRRVRSLMRRRRGRERWRRSLVPTADRPAPRRAMSSAVISWASHARPGRRSGFLLGLHDLVNLAPSACEEQRDQRAQYRGDQEFAGEHLQSPSDWLVRREQDVIVPVHVISRIAV
jgi:hypothetical protein